MTAAVPPVTTSLSLSLFLFSRTACTQPVETPKYPCGGQRQRQQFTSASRWNQTCGHLGYCCTRWCHVAKCLMKVECVVFYFDCDWHWLWYCEGQVNCPGSHPALTPWLLALTRDPFKAGVSNSWFMVHLHGPSKQRGGRKRQLKSISSCGFHTVHCMHTYTHTQSVCW